MTKIFRIAVFTVCLLLLLFVAYTLYATEQRDSINNTRYIYTTSEKAIGFEPSSAIDINLDDGALVFYILDRQDIKGFADIRQPHPGAPITGDLYSVRHPAVYINIGDERWSLTSDELRLALKKLGAKKLTSKGE